MYHSHTPVWLQLKKKTVSIGEDMKLETFYIADGNVK